MSNRDKFLLVIIGIAGVILLPYFLYIKDTRDRIVNLDNEIVQLEARYQELLEYEKNREMYETGIVEYNQKRDDIIAKYPADIQQASQVMYLLNAEYSEYMEFSNKNREGHEDDEVEIVGVEPTIRFNSGKFKISDEMPISSQLLVTEDGESPTGSELVETEYVALANRTELSFTCYDHLAVNHMLQYIRDDEDNPMIYSSISFRFDESLGTIKGSMSLDQYAVTGGEGREFSPIPIKPDIDEMNMRGNEDYGIFGPCYEQLYWEMKAAEEAEETGNQQIEEVVDETEN